jgi:hypothetical protein
MERTEMVFCRRCNMKTESQGSDVPISNKPGRTRFSGVCQNCGCSTSKFNPASSQGKDDMEESAQMSR